MTEEQLAFDWAQPVRAPCDDPDRPERARVLAGRLQRLAGRNVFLGASSWRYPGWLGQVYSPKRYAVRGRLSHAKFERECLREYAEVFPTLCGDFAFYQFPSPQMWAGLFERVPPGFRFSIKVPEEITCERFPKLKRYGQRAGQINTSFMDPVRVRDELLAPLEPYRDKLGPLIFEFGQFHGGSMAERPVFARRLDAMLAELPTDRYLMAVEIRNESFLFEIGSAGQGEHSNEYLDVLRDRGVAHCFNSWTYMPSVAEQLRVPGVFTAPHVVARFLLRPGRSYAQAVKQFSPYQQIQDPYPEGRDALRELIAQCVAQNRRCFAFVNNRFEGNTIETLELSTEGLGGL